MKRSTFIDFYLGTDAEDLEYIDEYLKERGIDVEKSKDEILKSVRKKRAQLKIEAGKELIRKCAELISNPKKLKELSAYVEKDGATTPEVRVAFRKLERLSANDIADILSTQEKVTVLEYLKHMSEHDSQE